MVTYIQVKPAITNPKGESCLWINNKTVPIRDSATIMVIGSVRDWILTRVKG